MSWTIRVGSAGFYANINKGATSSVQCRVSAASGHTVAQLNTAPGASKGTASTGQAERAWQNILSVLVER